MRIASLLPAATEIACALGLREGLVGRSHECDFPPGVEALPVLTDVLDDVAGVAAACGVPERGARAVAALRARLAALVRPATRPRVAVVEWLAR